jgi:hypothetical protein
MTDGKRSMLQLAALHMLRLLVVCHLRIAGVQYQRWQRQVTSKALCSLHGNTYVE